MKPRWRGRAADDRRDDAGRVPQVPRARRGLERRFQQVRVDEPTIDDTVQILRGLRDRYEAHHRCKISTRHSSRPSLADRYIQDRHLPDKAIDLIDEAGSRSASARCPLRRATASWRRRSRCAPTRKRRSRRRSSRRPRAAAHDEAEAHAKKKELEENWRSEADEEQPESARTRSPTSSRCGRDPGLQADRGRVGATRADGGRGCTSA